MFAYCLNNPVMLIDKSGQIPDSFAGGIGQDLGELIYEWLTEEEHPSKAAEEQEVEIRQRQNKLIRDGTMALWDASMRWYNIQQEAQFMEAQLPFIAFSTPEQATKTLGAVGAGLCFVGTFWGGPLLNGIGAGLLFLASIIAIA